MEKGVIGCSARSAGGLVAVRTESCRGCPALVEDQVLEVVGEVDQPPILVGTGTRGKTDGADEQPHALLLACEDVFVIYYPSIPPKNPGKPGFSGSKKSSAYAMDFK